MPCLLLKLVNMILFHELLYIMNIEILFFYPFDQIASEGLKHRVFEVSLADLQNDEDHSYRKIRLRAEDVQGKNVLTNFWVWCDEFFYCLCFVGSELWF